MPPAGWDKLSVKISNMQLEIAPSKCSPCAGPPCPMLHPCIHARTLIKAMHANHSSQIPHLTPFLNPFQSTSIPSSLDLISDPPLLASLSPSLLLYPCLTLPCPTPLLPDLLRCTAASCCSCLLCASLGPEYPVFCRFCSELSLSEFLDCLRFTFALAPCSRDLERSLP